MEVFNKMDKYSIINLKIKGLSNRKIAVQLGINRKTVGKIWTDYCDAQNQLLTQPQLTQGEREKLTELVINRSYNSESRTKRKLTPEVLKRLYEILEDEETKTLLLGKKHKQKLTCSQIHQILREEGVDIGLTTVSTTVKEIRESKEVFIKQNYHYGQRLEYDFDEVKLMIKQGFIRGKQGYKCKESKKLFKYNSGKLTI